MFRQRLAQGIRDLFRAWEQQIRTTFSDRGVLIFFMLVPLAYPLIYSFIYTNETIREVPAAVVDDSRSALSREYLRKVDATPDVRIAARCADIEEARRRMREHKAYGIIRIPADFADKLTRGEQTHVGLYCDMSGLLYYKALLTANTNVSLAMNADIRTERAGNTTRRQDEITAAPIAYEDVALYNPANGFAAFLIPAVLMLIIQQTLLLGIGLSAGTARERGLSPTPARRHQSGTPYTVAGTGLGCFTVYLPVSAYILCVVPRLFSLNCLARADALTLLVVPYLVACIFFAMTASAAVRNRETCMLLFVFTSVPLLFLSGISWPAAAVPPFWKYVSYLFPSTFGINGFVRINSMGTTPDVASFECRVLWVQAAFYFITACLVSRRKAVPHAPAHTSECN